MLIPKSIKMYKMHKNIVFFSLFALGFASLLSCGQGPARDEGKQHNMLTEQEKADGWELLFDGKTTRGWRGFQKEDLTIDEGWYAHEGNLVAQGIGGDIGGDIVTNRKFRNFIFETEWKISQGGNSGIFFNVGENGYPAVYATGPEYQLLDDLGYPDRLENHQYTAANYGMHAAENAPVRPAGEWNSTRIVVDNGRVEHWLNGQKVVDYELWTDDWQKLLDEGKWDDFPAYGTYREGHIALQDHGDKVWFRNMKIKVLD
jgi:hypothetical protein